MEEKKWIIEGEVAKEIIKTKGQLDLLDGKIKELTNEVKNLIARADRKNIVMWDQIATALPDCDIETTPLTANFDDIQKGIVYVVPRQEESNPFSFLKRLLDKEGYEFFGEED